MRAAWRGAGEFPVFSKPIINLKGMGIGSRMIMSAAGLDHHYQPGHMWMPLLTGDHVSSDCAVLDGEMQWSRQATGVPWTDGMFRHWTVHAQPDRDLEQRLGAWVSRHMQGYTGMMNFETIGGAIIEAHLRFADQWCDLYGEGWVEALVELYAKGQWNFADENRQDGYSVPLFARHGQHYAHPPAALQTEVRSMAEVKSLQITFHEGKPPEDHAMPPGGFRLAVINTTSLEAARARGGGWRRPIRRSSSSARTSASSPGRGVPGPPHRTRPRESGAGCGGRRAPATARRWRRGAVPRRWHRAPQKSCRHPS